MIGFHVVHDLLETTLILYVEFVAYLLFVFPIVNHPDVYSIYSFEIALRAVVVCWEFTTPTDH